MKDPGDSGKNPIKDIILILVIIFLVYVLYNMFGGNWSNLTALGSSADDGGFFGQITGSLGAFGQGLKGIFGNVAP